MASGWISKKKRHAIYERDKYTCSYCTRYVLQCGNKRLPEQIAYMKAFRYSFATLDHVVPKGTELVTACNKCNATKREFHASKIRQQNNIHNPSNHVSSSICR